MCKNMLIGLLTDQEKGDILNHCCRELESCLVQAKTAILSDMPELWKRASTAYPGYKNKKFDMKVLIVKLEFESGDIAFTKPIFIEKIDFKNNHIKEVSLENANRQKRNREKEVQAIEEARKGLSTYSPIKKRIYLNMDEKGDPLYFEYKVKDLSDTSNMPYNSELDRPLHHGPFCINFKPDPITRGKDKIAVITFYDESTMGMPTHCISFSSNGKISMEYYESPNRDYILELDNKTNEKLRNGGFNIEGINSILQSIKEDRVILNSLDYKGLVISKSIRDSIKEQVTARLGLNSPLGKNLNSIIDEEIQNELTCFLQRIRGKEPYKKDVKDENVKKVVNDCISSMSTIGCLNSDIAKNTRALTQQIIEKSKTTEPDCIKHEKTEKTDQSQPEGMSSSGIMHLNKQITRGVKFDSSEITLKTEDSISITIEGIKRLEIHLEGL